MAQMVGYCVILAIHLLQIL